MSPSAEDAVGKENQSKEGHAERSQLKLRR
jgi:hypothetical protein